MDAHYRFQPGLPRSRLPIKRRYAAVKHVRSCVQGTSNRIHGSYVISMILFSHHFGHCSLGHLVTIAKKKETTLLPVDLRGHQTGADDQKT